MIRLVVPGVPQPKGSTRALRGNRGGVVVIGANKKAAPWQRAIAWTARGEMRSRELITGPIAISAYFYFRRPPTQRPRRARPDVKPDLDKLLRCACDALTGVVYVDDCQVIALQGWKYYGPAPRAEFVIRELDADAHSSTPQDGALSRG